MARWRASRTSQGRKTSKPWSRPYSSTASIAEPPAAPPRRGRPLAGQRALLDVDQNRPPKSLDRLWALTCTAGRTVRQRMGERDADRSALRNKGGQYEKRVRGKTSGQSRAGARGELRRAAGFSGRGAGVRRAARAD